MASARSPAQGVEEKKPTARLPVQLPEKASRERGPASASGLLADFAAEIAAEIERAWKESLSDYERMFMKQVLLPAAGDVSGEESRRLGAWFLGGDPGLAETDLSLAQLMVVFIDDYSSSPNLHLGVLEADREKREGPRDWGHVVSLARIRSKSKRLRVVMNATVERRSKADRGRASGN